jgi:hypothetical protein
MVWAIAGSGSPSRSTTSRITLAVMSLPDLFYQCLLGGCSLTLAMGRANAGRLRGRQWARERIPVFDIITIRGRSCAKHPIWLISLHGGSEPYTLQVMLKTGGRPSAHSLWAGVLTSSSIIILVFLAYVSASSHPPTVATATLLAVLSGVSQLASSLVSRIDKPLACTRSHADSNFVKSAVARLASIGIQEQEAEQLAQKALEQGTSQSRREALGTLSVMMSTLQEQTRAAVRDWNNLAPDAVDTLIEEGRLATKDVAPLTQGAPNG